VTEHLSRRDTIRKAGGRVGLGHESGGSRSPPLHWARSLILRPGSMRRLVRLLLSRDDRNHGRNLYSRLPGNDPWWDLPLCRFDRHGIAYWRDRTDRIRSVSPEEAARSIHLPHSDPAVRLHGRGGAKLRLSGFYDGQFALPLTRLR